MPRGKAPVEEKAPIPPYVVFLIILGILVVVGLGAYFLPAFFVSGPKKMSVEEEHIKKLAVWYMQYAGQHRGQPPHNVEEFKKFAVQLDPQADKYFTSPRDNQPYAFNFKARGGVPGPGGSSPIIIYEQTGSGGKRYVADGLGRVEPLDEAQFKERQGH